jgi:hypothetical protein
MTGVQPGLRPNDSGGSEGRKGWMAQVIETLASGLGNSIAFLAESGILFIVFALIWGAFGVALVWSQGSLDAAWQWVHSLPLVLQGLVWLLFLPVMAGLWIWHATWPLILRLVLIIGIAGWNLLVFPKALEVRTAIGQ